MSLSRLFADNALVRLATGDSASGSLVVSMAGLNLGERLLVVGLDEPGILASLGAKVGISGRAAGVDSDAGVVRAAVRVAERAGVLVDVETAQIGQTTYDDGAFDVVVLRVLGDLTKNDVLAAWLRESRRVLRDGGRCLIIADGAPTGVRSWFGGGQPPRAPDEYVRLLTAEGYRGARILADRDGRVFVEAVSRVSSPSHSVLSPSASDSSNSA